jgi:hypothetical protein
LINEIMMHASVVEKHYQCKLRQRYAHMQPQFVEFNFESGKLYLSIRPKTSPIRFSLIQTF